MRFFSRVQKFARHIASLRVHGGQTTICDGGSRQRSTLELIWSFFQLLRGYRRVIAWSLMTLTIARLLALVPPVALKFVVDYVFDDKKLPDTISGWMPREGWPLLIAVTVVVFTSEVIKLAIRIYSRWHAMRATKLLELSVRKRVLEHTMRLPLYRVQELKSGGAASILRRDARDVGSLVLGMLYDPWRAVIQLVGSLCVLAWVDWRLLVGGVMTLPLVYISHRMWILRIRPLSRRVRAQRQEIDALATESFAGMRLVRAFGRERSETNRIMRGNYLMARQE
ncbi:MAG: ABC transporter ATP-binding protein, partial [Planctomycetaceae bacterium]